MTLSSWDSVNASAKGAGPPGTLKNKRKGLMAGIFFYGLSSRTSSSFKKTCLGFFRPMQRVLLGTELNLIESSSDMSPH